MLWFLLMMPPAPHDTSTGANGIARPKSHVTPHFDHPDRRNAMVPLMMLLGSYDASAGTNGVT